MFDRLSPLTFPAKPNSVIRFPRDDRLASRGLSRSPLRLYNEWYRVDKQRLRIKVREAYSAAAVDPERKHAFPVGEEFAQNLGYPRDLLATIPEVSRRAFSGVADVACIAPIVKGSTVLDLGCGAGQDAFIAADRVGPDGRVIGIDFSAEMLRRAAQAQLQTLNPRLSFCRADAERLPLRDGMIDIVLINGLFNLNPFREAIFREVGRVVRKGGLACAAELTLTGPLPEKMRSDESNWFA
jgi:SAM-dependent methyltransferase